MHSIQVDGRDIPLNDDGYLVNFEDWDRSVAETLAGIDHLTLTRCHWVAIDYMRDFYRQFEIPPSSRVLLKAVGDQIYENGCSKRDLDRIFPKGGCKHACRLAGLPEAYCHAC
ncbi:MAG: TusE/DsrC/DsvC family sulfur relay protein [Chromatiaceae bacterium]|nr:TusE/DsrC/DsvC family sulfur relay protein [Gammaproteobacteria bacterium]MCP5427493.1 TusE/DsrC/DsvC family sulfur relay protein [Chromatiaceae bacterium]MCB1861395.1 TusE/DsrC/DsvC family sulfur relay protein [Gammaproteobacteria bacterium]MCB1873357.1 TusE/DsrC/DsvC family sulfur relay protein [Gammaproteobacteria bacterium]MCB1879326.1 TusE/DsrC/DsvC family sulfur relay protein [Gammaproteobacteria bacterium]